MSIITIDASIQKLNLLARQINQIADKQNFALRPTKEKLKADLSFKSFPQKEVTLNQKRKKKDISQAKKLH